MAAIDKNGVVRSAHDLLRDIQWNCENCTARLHYESMKRNALYAPGGRVGGDPCRCCRLQKYGYGGGN